MPDFIFQVLTNPRSRNPEQSSSDPDFIFSFWQIGKYLRHSYVMHVIPEYRRGWQIVLGP